MKDYKRTWKITESLYRCSDLLEDAQRAVSHGHGRFQESLALSRLSDGTATPSPRSLINDKISLNSSYKGQNKAKTLQ